MLSGMACLSVAFGDSVVARGGDAGVGVGGDAGVACCDGSVVSGVVGCVGTAFCGTKTGALGLRGGLPLAFLSASGVSSLMTAGLQLDQCCTSVRGSPPAVSPTRNFTHDLPKR